MQKKNFIFIIIMVLMLGVSLLPHAIYPTAKADNSTTYLVSPKLIATLNQDLYIYDEFSDEIIKYSASDLTRTGSKKLESVIKMVSINNNLYVLTRNENLTTEPKTKVYLISADLSTQTEITFEGTFSIDLVKDFTISQGLIYFLKADSSIDYFTLSGTQATALSTISKNNIELIQNSSDSLTTIEAVGTYLHLTTEKISFNMNPSTRTTTELVQIEGNETITQTNKNFSLTSANCIIDTNTNTHFKDLCNIQISGFTASGNTLYLLSASTHQVFSYNIETGTLTDLKLNPDISVSNYLPQDFKHVQLTGEASLFLKPYSITPWKTLPASSYLNLIGEYNEFFYCLVTDGTKNEYLYLPKSTTFEALDIGSSSTVYTATRTISIFALPSTTADEKNAILKTLNPSEEILVTSATTLQNSYGDLFYTTYVNGTLGFVRSNFLQSTKGTVELTTPCNAKTKRETTLFEDELGSKKIITLEKGTRIALLEEVAPNKQYIKAEFQDTKGVIYSGYVYTEDVKTDGLSTLQILGLILILANITVLTLIIVIRKRSTKWKVHAKSHENPLPHHTDL